MLNRINAATTIKPNELKKHILGVAEKQLTETCIKAITMDGLAKKMGISKKTIYQYFVSKSDLVDCLVAEKIHQYKTQLERKARAAINAVEKAYLSWHIFDCIMCIFTPSLKDELQKQYPNAYQQLTAFTNEFVYRHIKTNIEKGIAEGLFRENAQPEIVAAYIANVLFNQYKDINFYPLKSSSLKVESEMLSYHLYAIATTEGAAFIEKYKKQYLAYSSGMDLMIFFSREFDMW